MSQLRTNAILDASGGTTATVNGIPLRPGVLDPENRIINGAFDFWQRGTSLVGSGYIADRWRPNANGGTVTTSRQAFSVGDTLGNNNPTFFLRQTVSGQSASANEARVMQYVEGVRSYAGQTITVLGWARRSSGSGNMAVEVAQDFGTGGSPSSAVLVAPQTVTLTSSFAPFALTFTVPSISGKTVGTNGNDLFYLAFWTSAGSDYNARTNSLGLQTIGVDLWGIHIKQGTHTTSAVDLYRQPELGPELARCQRYYWQIGDDTNQGNDWEAISIGRAIPNGAATFITNPVWMRSTPAMSFVGAANAFYINDGISAPTGNTISTDQLGAKISSVSFNTSGSCATGNAVTIYRGGFTQCILKLDAEL